MITYTWDKKQCLTVCDSNIFSDLKANTSSRDKVVCYIPMGRAGSIWHNSSMHDINQESDSCLLQWYLCNWVHCVFHVLPHNKIFWVPKSEQQISLLPVLLWYKSKSVWCNTVIVSLHMISTLAKCIRLIFSTLWPTLKIGYWLGI